MITRTDCNLLIGENPSVQTEDIVRSPDDNEDEDAEDPQPVKFSSDVSFNISEEKREEKIADDEIELQSTRYFQKHILEAKLLCNSDCHN